MFRKGLVDVLCVQCVDPEDMVKGFVRVVVL